MEKLLNDIRFESFKINSGVTQKSEYDSILLNIYKRICALVLSSEKTIELVEIIKEANSLSLLMDENGNDCFWLLFCQYCGYAHKDKKDSVTEQSIEDRVIESFSSIAQFSKYELVKRQFVTKNGRIDILAKCTETLRPVIIEVKKGNISAHRQLLDYAIDFDNPILISLSEFECKKQKDGIIYYSLDDLFSNIIDKSQVIALLEQDKQLSIQ